MVWLGAKAATLAGRALLALRHWKAANALELGPTVLVSLGTCKQAGYAGEVARVIIVQTGCLINVDGDWWIHQSRRELASGSEVGPDIIRNGEFMHTPLRTRQRSQIAIPTALSYTFSLVAVRQKSW